MNKLTKSGLLVASLVAVAVLSHYQLRRSSILYNFLFSPDDLYQTLDESDFDLSSQGIERELKFKIKYPGNHWLAILVESPPETTEKYKSDFDVKIQIFDKEGILTESVVSDSSLWFYGGQQRSGFALATFKVPSDLPLDQQLNIRVSVVKESPGFTKLYGKHRIIMSKFSDE